MSCVLGVQIRRRGNVILLGDSLGDLNMAKGAGSGEVLTVGFLNDKVGHLLGVCALPGTFFSFFYESRRDAYVQVRGRSITQVDKMSTDHSTGRTHI